MRIGILSCQHIHAHSYISVLNDMDNVEAYGIAEKDERIGKNFAQNNNLRYYQDYHQLLEEDIDAVIITSTNNMHADMAVAAAESGKNILIEKPISTNLEDAQKIIDSCKKNNVKLMVAFPVRYVPAVIRAKELIDNGEIGKIIAINGTNHGQMPGGWFVNKALSGGGAVIDHTVHVADLMHWFLKSDIKEVYAKIANLIYDIPVEDSGLLSMKFENDVYASLDTSWSRPESFPTWGDVTLEIVGTKGSINVDAFAQHGDMYSNKYDSSKNIYWGDNMDYLMIQDFVDSIKNDNEVPITGEDGLFALKVALMAYESASRNQVVK